MKRFKFPLRSTLSLSALTVAFLAFSATAYAQDADPLAVAAGQDEFAPAEGGIEILDFGGGACDDWISARGEMPGANRKADGSKYYVAVGTGTIEAPPGHPNYITSRQNAYEVAVLEAKAAIVEFMKQEMKNELQLATTQGTFTADKERAATEAQAAREGWRGAYDKAMRLLNAELDKQLAERGVPTDQPLTPEQQEIAREILNSKDFSQLTESTAKARLKGVRRMFVQENVPPNGQGSICTVMLSSAKTMAMADAIMTGNASYAPDGAPSAPLQQQIPNPRTPAGVRELMTSYGVQMSRDETGQFHLISYAQSGLASETAMSKKAAVVLAEKRAAAALASFAQEHAAITSRTENSESVKEFNDAMGEVDYSSNNAMERVISAASGLVNLQGGRKWADWAARHPVTKQAMVGVIYVWSPSAAADAREMHRDMAKPASRAPAISGSSTIGQGGYGTGQGFSGSASRGASEADF